MIMRKKDDTYKQVGFKKVRQADGTYKDVEFQYSKDSSGDYKLTFEKGFTREIEGELPLSLNGIGKDLKDYTLYGNTVQNGTPTTDNPVEVHAVGDRTGNLLDLTDRYFNTGSLTDWSQEKTSSGFKLDFSAIAGVARGAILSLGRFPAGTYTISLTQNPKFNSATLRKKGTTDNSNTATLTIDSEEDLELYVIGIKNKYTISNIMLNAGETALPYEPYGYKIPVETRGKNLFDKNDCTVVGYINSRGEIMYDGTNWFTNKNYIKCSGVITITALNGLGSSAHVACYDEQKNLLGACPISDNNLKQSTITLIDGTKYIKACSRVDNLDSFLLELGSTATEYEPYHEPITTTAYLDSPLYKIGDYTDSIGSKEAVRVIKELVLTGEEKFQKNNAITNSHAFALYGFDTPYISKIGLCTHLINTTSSYTTENSIYFGSKIHLCFDLNSEIATDTALLAWLKEQYANDTPIKIYYVLETPETESVTLPKLPTLDGTTVIDVETEIKPSNMNVKYKSSK